MTEQQKHKRAFGAGGRRDGAGRPSVPKSTHMVYMQITLTPAMRDFSKQKPGGASAYIRSLIQADRDLTKKIEILETR